MVYLRYLIMANKPRIRFRGFTEDWEQRKLGECMDSFEYGLNAAAKEYDGMHKYIRITDIDDETHNFIQSNLTSPDIDFNSDVSDYKLNVNDIVFARTGASVGKTYLYNQNDGDLYYAGFLIRGKVNEDCDAGFIYQNTLTTDYDSFIRITSQRSGQPGVNSKEYTTFRLKIPCKGEQEKISKLLNCLDKLFTLHQCKLKKLNLAKKSLLQKLFPRNGSQIPGVRFKGFTDAWEQRKLDDIAKIKTGGGTPKTANPEYWSGNIPWIQSSDLAEGDIVHVNINKFINNNALKNSAAKLISRDSIALVTRVGVGKVAVINQDFTTSQDFLSLSDFDGSDIKFLAYQLYRLMQENAKVLQGTSIKGITKTELIEQSISIPSSGQEQNLISAVLSKIDSIITLHQRKLERLQEVKKGLLQKMFV